METREFEEKYFDMVCDQFDKVVRFLSTANLEALMEEDAGLMEDQEDDLFFLAVEAELDRRLAVTSLPLAHKKVTFGTVEEDILNA